MCAVQHFFSRNIVNTCVNISHTITTHTHIWRYTKKMTNFFNQVVKSLKITNTKDNPGMYRYYMNEYGKDGARLYAEFLKTGRIR